MSDPQELGRFVGSAVDTFCRFADRSDIVSYGPKLESELRGYVASLRSHSLSSAKAHRENVVSLINTVHARSRRRTI